MMASLSLLCIAIYALSLSLLLNPATARASPDQDPRFRSEKYAKGFEGPFPLQRYRSADLSGPILNYWQRSAACQDGLYTILSPRGDAVRHSGPMILDQEGHLVWFKRYTNTYNANVEMYKGERYLTFWAGDDSVRGHGEGEYYMLNSHYEEAYKIHAVNGLAGDLHEFQITRDDTALFAVYEIRQTDLRSVGGPQNGWIYDGLFQEVDVETNALLFEWRASEYFPFEEAMRDREDGDGDTRENPWDFFHINSIDKDGQGNYLVSSRYMSCLAYIDGRTGDVLWKLGGKQNSFMDLSASAATNISWQHHARFQAQFDTNSTRRISLFDNGSRGEGAPEYISRGLLLEINKDAMTAAVVQEYWNPNPISSQSQGSMQILENGRVLLGYGYGAAWTEFTADGEVLCETHFGPMSQFHRGQLMSYRVFKQEWVGRPLTSPSVALSGTEAAVSWNGATEVVTWVLQGASRRGVETGEDDGGRASAMREDLNDQDDELEFNFVSAVPKTGFETIIPIPPSAAYKKLRIVALDKTGSSLSATEPLDWEPEEMNIEIAVYNGEKQDEEDAETELADTSSASTIGIGLVIVAVLGLCIWLLCKLAEGRSLKNLFTNEKDEEAWQKVHAEEELDDLDSPSDCESEDGASDSLLKPPER